MREVKINMRRSTWGKSALVAVLVATATMGTIASAVAQTTPPDEQRVEQLDLRGANMVEALRILTAQTGVQFIIEPSDQPFRPVTLKLGPLSVEDALKYICQAAGAYYRRDENGVYTVSQVKPEAAKPTEILPPVRPHTTVKKLKLMRAAPRDVYERILDINPLKGDQVFDTRIWQGMKDFAHLSEGDAPRTNPGVQLMQPSNVAAFPIPTSQIPTPRTGTDSAANSIQLPGEGANQIGGGGFGGGGLGGGGGFGGGGQGGGLGGGGLGGGGLGGGQGGGLQGGGNVNLVPGQGYVPQGITHITYDPTDNSLVVEGSDDAIDQLRKVVELFDVAPKQVTVKLEFISTSSDLAKEIGYDWLYSRGSFVTGNLPGSFANTGNPIFMSFSSGNVAVRMRTQLIQDHGKVVSAPIVRTLNNEPAQVLQNTLTYIQVDQLVSTGNGQVITAPQLYPINVRTQLSVAPRINRDGTITMYLNPQYSTIASFTTAADGTQTPNIFTQQLNVVARVKNGETIVLGGLVQKNDQTQEIKYPILGDLPIIGQFFRKTNTNNTDSELLIFVTPTVIEDDSSTGQGV
ncbi:MAG: hypothetical protein ACYC96_07770 [Fimbriimonadaceae bacterium]